MHKERSQKQNMLAGYFKFSPFSCSVCSKSWFNSYIPGFPCSVLSKIYSDQNLIFSHLVDAKVGGALLLDLPLHVHLHQARRSDLVVHHPWEENMVNTRIIWFEMGLFSEFLGYQRGWEESAQCLGWPLPSHGCICPATNVSKIYAL